MSIGAAMAGAGISGVASYMGAQQTNAANQGMAEMANINNRQNMKSAMIYNARMTREERKHQTMMSNTAMTRMKKDMERAGINPLLGIGSGASTPSAGAPSASPPTAAMAKAENAVGAGIASAIETRTMLANLEKQKKEIELIGAQTAKTKTDDKVAQKGIPQSDITNKFYKAVEPVVDKLTEGMKSGAKWLEEGNKINKQRERERAIPVRRYD